MPLESGRAEDVGDQEHLARFAISKSQFSRQSRRPKPALLSPNPYVELSLSRIDGLPSEKVQELGDDVAVKRGKLAALGYAAMKAEMPRAVGLDVIADEPLLHHCNITGWADSTDPAEKKRCQIQTAKALIEEMGDASMNFFG